MDDPVPSAGGSYRGLRGVGRVARIAYQAGLAFVAHEGFEMSGYAAFTALLSLFPFLLFLTALAGFVGDEAVASRVLAGALDFAPHEVVDVLRPVIYEVVTQRHGDLLTVGIVFALWSASSGVEALRTILNRSYDAPETRRVWALRPQSVVIVIFGSVIALLIASVIIIGPLLLRWTLAIQPADDRLWALLRYGVAGLVATTGLIVLHLVLPNRHLSIADVAAGAVITTLLWLAGAGLFSVYVEKFAHFNVTYGSLGGIILTLLFFYLTAIIFAYGAEINAQLQRDASERQAGDACGWPDAAPGQFSPGPEPAGTLSAAGDAGRNSPRAGRG